LLTQAQLAQALREQQQTHLRFGEVCLEHRWIKAEDFYQLTPSHSLCLGEILVARGYLEFDQLRIALAQQRRYGRKLGEILLWKGWIQPEVLEEALQEQRTLQAMASPNAWQAMMSLGNPATAKRERPASPYSPNSGFTNPNSGFGSNPGAESKTGFGSASGVESHSGFEVNTGFGSTHSGFSPAPLPAVRPPEPNPTSSDLAINSGFSDLGVVAAGSEKALAQAMKYRNRIEELELQLELQQRDWDAVAGQMNQQVVEFQTQYHKRIDILESKLRQQQIEQTEAQQALTRQYQKRIESLETELQKQRGREAQGTAMQEAHQRIERLETQLKVQWTEHDQAQKDLNERYQQRIDLLELKLKEQRRENEQAELAYQELNDLRSQVRELGFEIQRVQPFEEKYQLLSQRVQPMLQKLNQMKTQVQKMGAELQKSERVKQHYQQVLQQQKGQLEKAQVTVTKLTAELIQAKGQLTELSQKLQTQAKLPASVQARAQLKQSQDLIHAYRQSLETTQRDLKEQREQNRLLQAKLARQTLMAEAAQAELEVSSTPVRFISDPQLEGGSFPMTLDSPASADRLYEGESVQSPVLTPWARQLFMRLQEADLITDVQIERVLKAWGREGGKLTHILSEYTGLQMSTIRFFSDEGYAAKLYGCRRIGEYLKAAGLVTEKELEAALKERTHNRRIGEVLAEKGLIRPTTADYFARTFTAASQDGSRQSSH
jgi:hypothetical protein